MRVLLVSHTSAPNNGWGRYTRDLARSLREKGHTVTILNEWLVEQKLRPLRDPDLYLGVGIGWMSDALLLKAAVKALRPDVVHVTVEPYLSIAALTVQKRIKLVYTIHGTYAYYPQLARFVSRILHTQLYRKALARVHCVTPVSHNTNRVYQELLKRFSVPAPRTQVIHNGIWLTGLPYNPAPESEKSGFTISSIGAIKARKGILETVQGVIALKKLYGITAHYRIEGPIEEGNEYLKKIKELVASAGIQDQVEFLGRISSEAAQEEMRHAHVLSLLPRAVGNSLEGFGLVYLEANAYGVPGLGAKGTASEEAIKEGESGVLVDADNPEDIARGLKMLSERCIDPLKARAWAEAHDWMQIVSEYESVYA